jgi:uncharacterized paraquat-inducible protein A
MDLRQDPYPAYYCNRCHYCFILPKHGYNGTSCCPRCLDKNLYFGTKESFLRICATSARSVLPVEVGVMISKMLRRTN